LTLPEPFAMPWSGALKGARILEDGDFVERVLASAQETMEKR